ncbi:hypothetical protein CK203_115276 [Vitis vinifera]|uniref:NB-ARC domain-containing protein n=1 Tax=Vitis vinifera TaxID=29760 RepID=A0A438C507_VITVI|nr:hypothetical protein CK203_115276 [Vitis vinifera]
MRWIGVQFIPDLKTWIRIHSLDLKNSFHPWELDLKNALHPWELECLKRVGFRHWKVVRVIVVAVERVDDAEAEDQGRQLPKHHQFQGIRDVLLRKDITSSTSIQMTPKEMIQMRNTLYQLLAVYTDCLIFSEKHPIPSTKFLLPFYNLFHFWFLKSTKEELVRIKRELGLYPRIEDSNGSPDHSEDQESQSHDPENQSQIWYPHVSEIRGFDRQFSKIRNWLLQSDEGFKDIAIVGIGGSGKTALARQLFYDEHIQGAFFPTLWISLSGKIDADNRLKASCGRHVVELTTEHGHEKLRSCSTEEPLSSLGRRQALNWPDRDCNIQFGRDQKRNGNAVIITTRLEEVAKGNVGDKYLHSMEGIGVKTLAEIIPGALARDHSSVDAEPERGHIDSDHYSATQNHRGDT